MRVLIIEDDKQLGKFLVKGLRQEGFTAQWATNGDDGLRRALVGGYDAIVLDLMLPGMDGLNVLRELRKNSVSTPILILTARDAISDKVEGLNEGADDYLTKPFAFEELVARLRALVRRATQVPEPVLRVGDLVLDTISRTAKRGKRKLALSPTEYAVLELLMRHAGQPVSKARIFHSVWGEERETFSNVVEVYINYIRRKLEAGGGSRLIRTVRGVGYVIEDPGKS